MFNLIAYYWSMKRLAYLLAIVLCSCSAKEITSTTENYKADPGPYTDSVRERSCLYNTDEIITTNDTIPYWHDFNKNWYWDQPGKTTYRYNGWKFRVDGAFSKERWDINVGPQLNEDVGWYIAGRDMWIESENPTDSFIVQLAVHQYISEQLDYKHCDNPNFDYENWSKNAVRLEEQSDFYPLENHAGKYRLVGAQYQGNFFEEKYIQKYQLDTCSNYIESEGGGNYATLIVDGKKCIYNVDYGILKITRLLPNGKSFDYTIQINYSYGC